MAASASCSGLLDGCRILMTGAAVQGARERSTRESWHPPDPRWPRGVKKNDAADPAKNLLGSSLTNS